MDSPPLVWHGNQARHTYVADGRPVGFFTDPTICIGCKACEVACKKWNQLPDDGLEWSGLSYDNTRHLSASIWRHVSCLEQKQPLGQQSTGTQEPFRWIFMSDL